MSIRNRVLAVGASCALAVGLPVGGAVEGAAHGHQTSVKDQYGHVHTIGKEAEDAALGGAGGLLVDLGAATGGVLLWGRKRYNQGVEDTKEKYGIGE